ncbi:MAG: hypothetical protein SGCHY_005480 [Lobulomycetales sp.]
MEGDDDKDDNRTNPNDFLKTVIGAPVRVQLNSGIQYTGVLTTLDGYMNIALENTEEVVAGEVKNKYGECFIRGNNVLFISTK